MNTNASAATGAAAWLIDRAEYAVRGAPIDQVQPFAFDRGPIGCVLLHGFTAAPKEMRPLGDYLAARDYHRARRALCRTWHHAARFGAHDLARLGRFGRRGRGRNCASAARKCGRSACRWAD